MKLRYKNGQIQVRREGFWECFLDMETERLAIKELERRITTVERQLGCPKHKFVFVKCMSKRYPSYLNGKALVGTCVFECACGATKIKRSEELTAEEKSSLKTLGIPILEEGD